MGAGKSYLGQALAKHLQTTFIDLDQYIEQATGQTIVEIFQNRGEAWFRQAEALYLQEVLEKAGNAPQAQPAVIATGGGTPCTPHNIALLQATAFTIYLQVNEAELIRRLQPSGEQGPGHEQARPLVANLNPATLQQFIQERMTLRRPFYEQAQIIVNASVLKTIEGKPRLSLFYPILQQYVLAGWLPETVLQNLP